MEITTAILFTVVGSLIGLVASLLTKFVSEKLSLGKSKIDIGGVEIQLSTSIDESTRKILDRVQELQESPQVFISHSSQDKEFARRLATDLQRHGVRVWLAEEQLRVGDSILNTIREGISSSQYIIVLLSDNSFQSEFIGKELELALDEEKKRDRTFVLPAMIGQTKPPVQLQDKKYADFSNDYNLGLENILARIKPLRSNADDQSLKSTQNSSQVSSEYYFAKLFISHDIQSNGDVYYERLAEIEALSSPVYWIKADTGITGSYSNIDISNFGIEITNPIQAQKLNWTTELEESTSKKVLIALNPPAIKEKNSTVKLMLKWKGIYKPLIETYKDKGSVTLDRFVSKLRIVFIAPEKFTFTNIYILQKVFNVEISTNENGRSEILIEAFNIQPGSYPYTISCQPKL